MPNGEMYPCHFFVEHFDYCIATFKEGQFDFSNYPMVLKKLEMAHHMKNEKCKECWVKPTCIMCSANILLGKEKKCEGIRDGQREAILKCAKGKKHI